MANQADLFVDCRCDLSEGPFWHPGRNELFWFDINKGDLHRANEAGEVLATTNFGEPVSGAALVDNDTLMIAGANGLSRYDIETARRERAMPLETDNPATRSNDARVAPDGSWWIGTMARTEKTRIGALYRVADGAVSVLKHEVQIPNAICFAPDGSRAYFADTPQKRILQVALNRETGLPEGEWELFVDLGGQPGAPDGAVTDCEGFVWNAEYNGGRVVRYAPDGQVDRIVEVPCPAVTCPAFGGADLKTLYITTASQMMDQDTLARYPHSGSIFCIAADVPGVAEVPVRL